MYQTQLTDTIVALSTGQGVAAISVIRMSGSQAVDIADRVFKGKILSKAASHSLHYGRIIDEEGRHLDDVVIGIFRGPNSYTTQDIIEISCHGSSYIIREVLALLIRQGARLAEAGEFTMRAFLNGRMDLSQAEAVADLIASQSRASHDLAVQQMRGGVSTEIKVLRQKLLDFVSLIELELDFSEEDVEFADRTQLRVLVTEVIDMIRKLKNTFELGNAIREGIPTVIAGRPNAGKSTLLNALLEEERAIVSAIPGTTRDTIEEVLVIDGIQFRLIDTAGIREAHDEIEVIGIKRTMEKIEQASILIYVFDVTEMKPEDVARDLEVIQPGHSKVILAPNKMDLNPYSIPESYSMHNYRVVPLSALNHMNVQYLKEVLGDLVRKDIPDTGVIISSARHYHALDRAEGRLVDVLRGLGIEDARLEMPDARLEMPDDRSEMPNARSEMPDARSEIPDVRSEMPDDNIKLPTELVAQDIRQAMYHLAEISGEISTEDVLGNIFGRFCIGK